MTSQPKRDRGRAPRDSLRACPPPCPHRDAVAPSGASRSPDRSSDRLGRRRSALSESLATQRLLRLKGFSETEATNLTAYMAGLRPVEHGWTLHELDRLLFLRWLVDSRRLES